MSDIQDRMKFNSGTDKVTKSVADAVSDVLNSGQTPKSRFEQQAELSEKSTDLKSIITPQVQQYIPEIEIQNVSLKDGGIAGHKLFVTVNYSLVMNDEKDSVTLSFTNENFNDK